MKPHTAALLLALLLLLGSCTLYVSIEGKKKHKSAQSHVLPYRDTLINPK